MEGRARQFRGQVRRLGPLRREAVAYLRARQVEESGVEQAAAELGIRKATLQGGRRRNRRLLSCPVAPGRSRLRRGFGSAAPWPRRALLGKLRSELCHDRLDGGARGHGLAPAYRGEAGERRELVAGLVNGVSPGAELRILLLLRQARRLAGVQPVEELALELLDRVVPLGGGAGGRHRGRHAHRCKRGGCALQNHGSLTSVSSGSNVVEERTYVLFFRSVLAAIRFQHMRAPRDQD